MSAIEHGHQVQCLCAILSRMNPIEQGKLFASRTGTSESRVWLARDSSFSDVDPLQLALSLTSNVEIHDRLPTAPELNGYAAIVVECKGKNTPGWTEQDVAACRNAGIRQLPLLWLINDLLLEPGDGRLTPAKSISVQALQDFTSQAATVADRLAA